MAVITGSSVKAATVYDDGVAGPVSEVTLGDFRPDLSVHGRTLGSIPNAAGDNLDGARIYIWDFLDVTFSRYAMMVFEMDQPYDGVRLYTHQDHYGGGPITTAFVAQDVMEYSVWGSNAVTPTTLADWVLLSDVIAYDIIGGGAGKPTYTFAGLDGGEASIVFRGGSPEFGVVNAYTREYEFSSTYKWFGFRSSTISIVAGDADPELDAIGGFSQIDRNAPPEASCTDVTVSADGNCVANASIDDGSFDPDGDPITLVQAPPGPYPLGQTLVTLTVTDDKGASDQCQATVTVVDNTDPVANCPGDITVDNEPGRCDATVSWNASATDNCPGAGIACVPPSGSVFPVGVTPVICTATDAAGNVNNCTFTVTVEDNEAPVI
ncbi:MAG: HYR domain-containing protein, partial [Acidobacteria bacterium]|nr:HYR domain-containing protein [Acidobacteriota bacterium]